MFLPNRSAKAFLLVLLVCLSAACSKETEQAIPLLQVTSPIPSPSPSPRGVAERQQENQQQSGGEPKSFDSRNNGTQKVQSVISRPLKLSVPLNRNFLSAPSVPVLAEKAKSQLDTTPMGDCRSEVLNGSETFDAEEEFFDAHDTDCSDDDFEDCIFDLNYDTELENQLGEDRTDAGATVLKQEKLFNVGRPTGSITKNKRLPKLLLKKNNPVKLRLPSTFEFTLILSNIDNSKNHIDPDFIAWFIDLLERAIRDGNTSMDYIARDRALILFKYIETYWQDSSYLEKLNGRYNSYEYFKLKLKLYVDKKNEFALFVLMELSPFSFTDHSIESVIFYFDRDYIKINPSSVNDKQSSELSSSAVLDSDKIVNFYKSLVKYNDPQPEENQFEKAVRRIQAQFRGYKSREEVSNLLQCYKLLSNFFKPFPILDNFENYLNENVTSSKVLLEIVRILYHLIILEESSDFKKSLESMYSIASDNHKKRTFEEIQSHPLQSVEDEFWLKESKRLKESIYLSSSSAAVASDRIINSFSVQEGQDNDLDADNFQGLSGFEGSDVIDNQDNLKGQLSEDNSEVKSCYAITCRSEPVITEHAGSDKCDNNYCAMVKINKKCDKSASNNQLIKAETNVDDQENLKEQPSENYSEVKPRYTITGPPRPVIKERSESDKCNNSSHVMFRINNNYGRFVSNDQLIKAETDVGDQNNPKGQTSENYSKVASLSHPRTFSSVSDNSHRVMSRVNKKFEYELKSIENFTPSEIPSEKLLEQPLFYFENSIKIDPIQEIEKNNSAVAEKKALQKNFKILIKWTKPREKSEHHIKDCIKSNELIASKQASVPMSVLETGCINLEMFSDPFKIEENSEKNFRPSIHQNIEQSENSSQAVAVQSISQDINQDSFLNEELQSEQFIKPIETNDDKTSESMNQDDLELDLAEISLLEASYQQKVDAWLSEINESEKITNHNYSSFLKDRINEYFVKITTKINAEIESIDSYSDLEPKELIENYSLLKKHFKILYLICENSTHFKPHAKMFKSIADQFGDVSKSLENMKMQEDVKKIQEDVLVELKKIMSSLLETAKQRVLEVKESFQSKLQVKKSNNQEDKILSISQYIEEVLDNRVTSSSMYEKDNSKIHYYAMDWVIKYHFNDKKNDISNESSNLFDTVYISPQNIDLILEEEHMNAFFDNISEYIKKHNEMHEKDKDSTVKGTYIRLRDFFEWIKTEYKCSDYSYESSTLDKIIDKFNQEIESQKNRPCLSENNSLLRIRTQNNFEIPERRDANSDNNFKIDVETKKDGNKEEKEQRTILQSLVDSYKTIITLFNSDNKKLKNDDFTECDVEENSTFDASSLPGESTSQYSCSSSIRKRK